MGLPYFLSPFPFQKEPLIARGLTKGKREREVRQKLPACFSLPPSSLFSRGLSSRRKHENALSLLRGRKKERKKEGNEEKYKKEEEIAKFVSGRKESSNELLGKPLAFTEEW